jgi:hypothetical protein
MTTEAFKETFYKLMKERYGLTPGDMDYDDEKFEDLIESGETPDSLCQWEEEKWDLDRIDSNPWRGI